MVMINNWLRVSVTVKVGNADWLAAQTVETVVIPFEHQRPVLLVAEDPTPKLPPEHACMAITVANAPPQVQIGTDKTHAHYRHV